MTQEGSANNHLVTKSYIDNHSTNTNYVKVDGSNMMTGDLNMNEQRVKNTLDPSDEQDTVNKRYLESQLTDYLKTDGQNPMTFNLNMNNYRILNVKDFDPSTSSLQDVPNIKYIQDNFLSSNLIILTDNLNAANNKIFFLGDPVDSLDAVNKKYVDDGFIKKNGSNAMFGNLNLNNNKIINLHEPILNSDATNKKYVDNKTRINPSHSLTNSFQYLMNDINEISTEYGLIADKIDDLSWSPHENKKVLYFKALKDGLNYRYRLGFQMTQASPIANTIAIEQLFNNENYWNKAEILINGTGITIESSHTNKFHFSNYYYTKTIVQLKRLTAPVHQLYYTTHIDNVTSSPVQLQQYLLAYGVNSFMSDVDSIVYNIPLFKNVNDKMQMQVELDMNNKKISNVASGVNDNDVVNKKQMENSLKYFIFGEINIGENTFSLNGAKEIITPYRHIKEILFVYKTYISANAGDYRTLPRIGIEIKSSLSSLNFRTLSNGINQRISVNQKISESLMSVDLTSGPINNNRLSRDKILMLIELSFHL